MASKTEIINVALVFLGEPDIGVPTEDSKLASVAGRVYEISRDYVLADHPWNFAMKRSGSLAELPGDTPSFEFSHSFMLPTDCLVARYTEDQWFNRQSGAYWPWKVRGRLLETDLDEVKILYTRRVLEEGYFSPGFTVAFAAYLAYMMSMSTTEHRNQTESLLQQYKGIHLADAKFQDAVEGTSDAVEEGNWLESRA
jgi:hypothetical protein